MGKFFHKPYVHMRPFWIAAVIGLGIVSALLFLGWANDRLPDNLQELAIFCYPASALSWLIVLGWVMWSREIKWKRRALTARGRLCLHCGFNMTGLEDGQSCPECGSQYNEKESQSEWRRVAFGRSKTDWDDAK